jgi:hypothetical protein
MYWNREVSRKCNRAPLFENCSGPLVAMLTHRVEVRDLDCLSPAAKGEFLNLTSNGESLNPSLRKFKVPLQNAHF